ncbi:Inositol polyphosphate multikinase [Schistosoma japonicum]|nr:Inositol polyphosphate multikinase [Schistosoma japonicum]KAH8857949.1 Inositol polyphosphate multikinase [Schistosoma japonicum]
MQNPSMGFGDVLPLPTCTEPYAFQVAGHSRENSSNFEILRDKSKPLIYKSLQDCQRGMREVMFYRRVFSPDASEALILLRQFIPIYFGIFRCPTTKAFYMGLSDLVANFKQPNVCDFKMGTITYFPDSSEDKIAREQSKYAWRRKLGFVLSGMQVYDTENHYLIKFPKEFGRNLTPEQVYSVGVKTFLGSDSTYCIKLAQNYIQQLGHILNWYVEYGAELLTFCRSSLLLIHETINNNSGNSIHDHCPSKSCPASLIFPSSSTHINNTHTLCATTTVNPTIAKVPAPILNQLIKKPSNFNHSETPLLNITKSSNGGSSSSSSQTTSVHTQVYLIDFAHWEEKSCSLTNDYTAANIHANNNNSSSSSSSRGKSYWTCELTDGFRHGLKTLISLMQRIVNTENDIDVK